eukprot:GHVT01088121.1.p1 GENE.GHVT01088121.1~~GHVT01088121.1.p1  ORF type:complete len:507 (+),score=105.61 GHVT01088121.1:997-2517(+)
MIKPKTVRSLEKSVQADILDDDFAGVMTATTSRAARATKGYKEGDTVTRHEEDKTTATCLAAPAAAGAKSREEKLSATRLAGLREEKQQIIRSPEFAMFFSRASKKVERVLGESAALDVLTDYSGIADAGEGPAEGLKKASEYSSDERWTRRRAVTSLDSSVKFPELFLASYGRATHETSAEPEGCVLVWNVAMTQRPEFLFSTQSSVCCALFHPFHPKVIVGGTYTGSIVQWDLREQAKPVQRSTLSNATHTHPVYSLRAVGSANACSLVSADTNGRVCVWSSQMLSKPQLTIDLSASGREVSCGCVDFAAGEANELVAGLEDGTVAVASLHGLTQGITNAVRAHEGIVTGLHFHPSSEGQSELDGLVLSSSVDWTIKLWHLKTRSQPIATFETAEDYVWDVRWHPKHPAVFAGANGDGTIDLWNINSNQDDPVFRASNDGGAINKIVWSSDGRRLISGDARGKVAIWTASSAICHPRPDDGLKVAEFLDDGPEKQDEFRAPTVS